MHTCLIAQMDTVPSSAQTQQIFPCATMRSQVQLSDCCQFCFKSNTLRYLCGSCGLICCTRCSDRTLAPQFTAPNHRTRFCSDCAREHTDEELFELASNRQRAAAEQQAVAEELRESRRRETEPAADIRAHYQSALVDLANRDLPRPDFLGGAFCTEESPFGDFGREISATPRRRQ